MIWAIGKKDSPKTEPSVSQEPVSTLAAISSPEPQPTQALAPEHFVNADKLNLRAQPGGKVITSLKRGEKVQVYEQKQEWARISLDGQPQRWISYKTSVVARTALSPRSPEGSALPRSEFEAHHLNMDHRAPAPLVVFAKRYGV
ncbi:MULTISPECIES: SH3 domain-containing protein [Pseudomonas]|jgi:uncharacterized protein YgiM (DUF1202 family)|uniref:SH3 domain-containing protein n=1 Tax=Pseudomonas TaxID=286 RepID=UPI0021F82C0A|nr:SH3 domain-containing protein [Pseudomonas putida]